MTKDKIRKQRNYNDSLIRTIRISLGLTTEKLAELAGVEYYIAYRAELGRPIRQDKIYKICSVLNISPDILFYSIGQIPKEIGELIKKDPLSFKEKVDELYLDPSKLTKTIEYIHGLKGKMEELKIREHENSKLEMNKFLSDIKPVG